MNPIRRNSAANDVNDLDTLDKTHSPRDKTHGPSSSSVNADTSQEATVVTHHPSAEQISSQTRQENTGTAESKTAKSDFVGARAYALARLETQLPPQFGYHSLEHTRDNVYPTALRIATLEGVGEHDILLIKTAAFFHDLGFTEAPYASLDHEVRGAHIAETVLPDFGYSDTCIHTIQGMIRATKLPQQPRNLLENIMADADLSVLGQLDFLIQNKALRAELESSGLDTDDNRWLEGQYNFLNNHRYYTRSAKQLLCAQKAVNLAALRTLLAKLDQAVA